MPELVAMPHLPDVFQQHVFELVGGFARAGHRGSIRPVRRCGPASGTGIITRNGDGASIDSKHRRDTMKFDLRAWRSVNNLATAPIDMRPFGESMLVSTNPLRGAMSLSADAMYKMSDVELLAAFAEARRLFVEQKFLRDTQRARLEWIRAKMFVSSSGGVTERNMVIDVSEEIAKKGQELREMTRDLDLLKIDADIIGIVIRSRAASAATGGQGDDQIDGDHHDHGATPDASD
jgi:hypothetical protein